MKKSILIASFAALALIAGCNDNADTKSESGSMGVVGETKSGSCEKSCSSESAGSMGFVSEKSGCEAKSDCSTAGPATCPMSGKQN
jgi:hypothetical protein